MTMRMLHAGGIPPVDGSGRDSYELDWDLVPSFAAAPPELLSGRAVKLLDMVVNTQARWPDLQWRIIWLDRDPVQQARSTVKFFGPRGLNALPLTDVQVEPFAQSLRDDRPVALRHLKSYGRVLIVAYADVLRRPYRQAERIAAFLEPHFALDVDAAAAVVDKRTPDCLPWIAEPIHRTVS